MGNLINAAAYHIGFNRNWDSNWYISRKKNLYYVLREDVLIRKYIDSLHENVLFSKFNIYITNLKIIRKNNSIFLIISLIDRYFNLVYNYFWLFMKRKIDKSNKVSIIYERKKIISSPITKKQSIKENKKILKEIKKNYRVNLLIEKKWSKPYGFIISTLNPYDILFLKKVFFKNKIKYYSHNISITKFIMEKQKIILKKIIKISLIIFNQLILKPFYYELKKIVNFNLNNIISKKNNNKVSIRSIIIMQKNFDISADILNKYIKNKLKNNYPLNTILKSINTLLQNSPKNTISTRTKNSINNILGYKIAIKGRFHRRGRARFIWKQINKIQMPRRDCFLDYNSTVFKTKFSLCGIKSWVLLNKNRKKKIFQFI